MKINQYFSDGIKALKADKLKDLQAPVFEELDDSATSKIFGLGPAGTWRSAPKSTW